MKNVFCRKMFYCQKDSFAKEVTLPYRVSEFSLSGKFLQFETEVVSCTPVTRKVDVRGKKVSISGCEVVCRDTVLFPEGGGQNSDTGAINSAAVVSVTRRGATAVHLLDTSQDWAPGTRVTQVTTVSACHVSSHV